MLNQWGDGGQAFPRAGNDLYPPVDGMCLRDYLAAQALIGILASCRDVVTPLTSADGPAIAARVAYYAADAMLQQRLRDATPIVGA
jgi:hypothetical protein